VIRNIAILTMHDLATAFKNKTLALIFLVPLFVFAALEVVDENGAESLSINLGLVVGERYPPALLQSLQTADSVLSVSWLTDLASAEAWLREREGDGVLVPAETTDETVLIVLTKTSLKTAATVETLARLQRGAEARPNDWISAIHPLQDPNIQRQMLPTWILMLVLLVGFIVLPTQVAEEKEKKLLLGLLQTPIRESEWLIAKVTYGTILIVAAVLFLHLLTSFNLGFEDALIYGAFVLAGSFCFCSFGVFVGFLCRTQASARTLGVLFYLPHLLPSALSDFSKSLNTVAPLIPSYQFYKPIKSILLEGGGMGCHPVGLVSLVALGLTTSLLSYLLIKRRWLM
jgi:ABC-2 type transport system permease protein